MFEPTENPVLPLARPRKIGDPSLREVIDALIESEERYRSIVTAMSEGIVLQDAEGRIVECNASAERILGLTREQMMGLTSLDPRWKATDEQGRPSNPEDHPIRITLRTGEPQRNYVMGVQRSDGERLWVRVNTQPLVRPGETRPFSVVASFEDITQSRRSEAALRESEERFRSLFEYSIDGVLLTSPDGSILAANPEACRLLGRTEQEICSVGRPGILDGEDPGLAALLEERRRTGKVRGEVTMIRGDGTRFPAEFSSAVFADRHGQSRTSITFRDVSQRRQAEDALREANQRLEERVTERTREITALLEIGRKIASQLELEPLLADALVQLKTVVDYTGAAIAIVEDDALVFVDYTGPVDREKIVGTRIATDRDSGYQRVLKRRQPVIVDDIWADEGANGIAWPIWDGALAEEMSYARSWLGVPLLAQGGLIGLLRLDHAEPGRFTEHDTQLAMAFAYQSAVAIVNAQLHRAAQRAAAVFERERLARELHDSVSQALYGIALGAHTARSRLGADDNRAGSSLDYVLRLATSALAEMRALIFELRPESLATDGLVAALNRHADVLRARDGLEVELRLPEEPDLDLPVKEALYRIAQEASNNSARHAKARHMTIEVRCNDDAVALEVIDDGEGFDALQPYPGHLGMRSMQERAVQIGASWQIDSEPGKGTRVVVSMPLRRIP